ncbi:MAG: hypothetical protein AB7G93_15235 [Bdellovibrionales bacterium]
MNILVVPLLIMGSLSTGCAIGRCKNSKHETQAKAVEVELAKRLVFPGSPEELAKLRREATNAGLNSNPYIYAENTAVYATRNADFLGSCLSNGNSEKKCQELYRGEIEQVMAMFRLQYEHGDWTRLSDLMKAYPDKYNNLPAVEVHLLKTHNDLVLGAIEKNNQQALANPKNERRGFWQRFFKGFSEGVNSGSQQRRISCTSTQTGAFINSTCRER